MYKWRLVLGGAVIRTFTVYALRLINVGGQNYIHVTCPLLPSKLEHSLVLCSAKTRRRAFGMYELGQNVVWRSEFTAKRGKATRTFLCTVPVCRRRVTAEQRRIRAEKRATRCWASDRAGSMYAS